MNELARKWIRRIAMGASIVPIGAVVLVTADCSCPPYHQRFAIDEATAAQILSADHDEALCQAICSGLMTGSADGGTGDAGFTIEHGDALDCSLTAEADMLYADCEWQAYCIGGRRPAGLVDRRPRARSEAGAWLARMAWMEEASVVAFEELAHDLARFGAPPALVAGARRAAGEERRHARAVGALARARGATPAPIARHAPRRRPLIEIAIENAAEGVVRETYGAFVAAHQAAFAADRDVRAAMSSIAREEASHALLSDAIDRWARGHVDASLLDRARTIAAREAQAAARDDEVSRASAAALGLPDAAMRMQFVSALA